MFSCLLLSTHKSQGGQEKNRPVSWLRGFLFGVVLIPMYLHMMWSVYMWCMHMRMQTCLYTQRPKRVYQVACSITLHLIPLTKSLLLNPEAAVGQNPPVSAPQPTGAMGTHSLIWFLCGRLGIRIQVRKFVQQTFLPAEPFPQPRFL